MSEAPWSMSSGCVDGHHGKTVSADHHFSTRTAVLRPLDHPTLPVSQTHSVNVPANASPRPGRPLVSQVCFQESAPMPTCHLSRPSSSQQTPLITPQPTYQVWPHGEAILVDGLVKDPEVVLDTQGSDTTNVSQPDPSIMVTALITALGLLTSHSSNPKVAVFQLSAAAISFTLIALHSLHSKTLENTKPHSFVRRPLKYFPLLIFASCWILFLLSVSFASPKVMAAMVSLVVLASIPMVFGAQLPAALTLAIITLFGLVFLTLVFLVCFLPTKWLA